MKKRNMPYTPIKKNAQIRDIIKTLPSRELATAAKQVGKHTLIEATSWHVMLDAAPISLNFCCFRAVPEANIAMPSTSKRLDRIDPKRLPWTTLTRPALTA